VLHDQSFDYRGAGAARSDVNLTVIKIISEGIRRVDEALKVLCAAVPCVSRYFGNLAQPISLVGVITARDRALGAAARLGPHMG
jgi:hypothetical protein